MASEKIPLDHPGGREFFSYLNSTPVPGSRGFFYRQKQVEIYNENKDVVARILLKVKKGRRAGRVEEIRFQSADSQLPEGLLVILGSAFLK